jgi:hypothetical protein
VIRPKPLALLALLVLGAGTLLAASRTARRLPPAGPAPSASAPGSPPASAPPPSAPPPAPPLPPPLDTEPRTLPEQRAALYRALAAELDLTAEQQRDVAAIIDASPYIGQGNPAISRHPMTRAECRRIRAAADAGVAAEAHPPCRRNMVPVSDPGAGEAAAGARVCIDQFEFPDLACEYPVVYASAREAALLCAAEGKRLCDAHEWEGACAGALQPPEVAYHFGKPRPYATWLHNKEREVRWAYGPTKDDARCGMGSTKSPGCAGGGWSSCGSNTYPAGAFPGCVSPLGVHDLHGNVAEHLNLPLTPAELTSRGGSGQTEMKGSWFAFRSVLDPHEDDCHWRAKDWHPSRVMDVESHRNYHLGFRCCASVGEGG